MTTMETIRQHIEAQPTGEPFSINSLLALGSRAAVDQSLTRLTKEGAILRVARGIYVRPKVSRFVGKVVPEVNVVVRALAESRGEAVHVHGAEAVLRLGLTTQVPMKSIYYTSGPSRKLHVGSLEVVLKHASQRLLALSGSPAGLAFSALWYMGKEQVTPETIAAIQSKLSPEEFSRLQKCPQLPAWLSSVFYQFEKTGVHT